MIDLQKIADELGFDIEDVEMLMKSFCEAAEQSILLLKEAIDKNDLEKIFRLAHSINGSASNLILLDISNIAKDIELAAMEKEIIDYTIMFEKLKKLIKKIYI